MKIKKYKAYCFIQITDDLRKLPTLRTNKRELVNGYWTRRYHPCDDPRKRGVVCEAQITVNIPPMPAATDSLREYIEDYEGHPIILEIGNDDWNRSAIKRAKAEKRRKLRLLRKAMRR